jgi:hypothetical protein
MRPSYAVPLRRPLGADAVVVVSILVAACLVASPVRPATGHKLLELTAAVALCFVVPVWAALLAALALAADWGSLIYVSPSMSAAIAVLLIVCVLVRSVLSGSSRLSTGGAAAAAGVIGGGLFVAAVDGNNIASLGVWRAALPYLLLALVAVRLDAATYSRLFDAFSAFAVLYCALFLLQETTSHHWLPGVTSTQQADLGGSVITRVQTYGQLVPTIAFLWAVASLLARVGSRRRAVFVAGLAIATVVAGLGRTALIALLLAGVVTAILAAARQPNARGAAVKLLGGCAVTFGIAFLYLSERLSSSYQELTSGGGNWGVRLAEWHERAPIISSHLLLGVGWDGQPDLGTSDSSLASALVRFGFLGLAAGLVVVIIACRRASRIAAEPSNSTARDGLFVFGGLVYLTLAAATTSSLYYPFGIAVFALLVGRAWSTR